MAGPTLTWAQRRKLYDPDYKRMCSENWTVEDDCEEPMQNAQDDLPPAGVGALSIAKSNDQPSEVTLENYIQSISEEYSDERLVLEQVRAGFRCRSLWKHLWEYRPHQDSWSIELVNVKGFCENYMNSTLSFIHTEQNIKREYTEYQGHLQRIYSDLEKNRMGYLPPNRIKPGNLAVIKLEDVGFVRVLISRSCKDVQLEGGALVELLDYNSSKFVNPKELMYATTISSKLLCQTNDLFPYGLATYRHLPEFRLALKHFVLEHGCFFSARVLKISRHKVAIVNLSLPGLIEPVNQLLKISAIKLFKQEELITEGEVRSAAYVTRVEATGEMVIQFATIVYDLCFRELSSITKEVFESHKDKGPYTLNKSDIYLALYFDGQFYRAKIVSHESLPEYDDDGRALVFFIDYGHYQYVHPRCIVPATVINPYLPHFPPQAVKARLVNGKKFPVHQMPAIMPPEMETMVETLRPATDDSCAIVEIMTRDKDNQLSYLSKRLGSKGRGFLDEPSLSSSYVQEIIFSSLEVIDMRNTPWKNAQGQILKAITEGDILDVFIPLSVTPEEFSIQPFGFQIVLEAIESELTAWLHSFQPEHWEPLDALFGSVYIMDLDSHVRVKLTESLLDNQSMCLNVLFVDYGRYVPILKERLCMISMEACSFPCFGARGSLRLQDTNTNWSRAELNHFVNNTSQTRFLFRVSSSKYDMHECNRVVGELYRHPSVNGEIPSPEDIKNALKKPLELNQLLQFDASNTEVTLNRLAHTHTEEAKSSTHDLLKQPTFHVMTPLQASDVHLKEMVGVTFPLTTDRRVKKLIAKYTLPVQQLHESEIETKITKKVKKSKAKRALLSDPKHGPTTVQSKTARKEENKVPVHADAEKNKESKSRTKKNDKNDLPLDAKQNPTTKPQTTSVEENKLPVHADVEKNRESKSRTKRNDKNDLPLDAKQNPTTKPQTTSVEDTKLPVHAEAIKDNAAKRKQGSTLTTVHPQNMRKEGSKLPRNAGKVKERKTKRSGDIKQEPIVKSQHQNSMPVSKEANEQSVRTEVNIKASNKERKAQMAILPETKPIAQFQNTAHQEGKEMHNKENNRIEKASNSENEPQKKSKTEVNITEFRAMAMRRLPTFYGYKI